MKGKSNKKLYTKILRWAYKKGQSGFTQQELLETFNLNSRPKLKRWVIKVFFRSSDNDRGLIDLLERKEDGNTSLYALTDKGMSAVIGYLELRQARIGGYVAAGIGTVALIVAIYTSSLTKESLEVTRETLQTTSHSLELSATPVVSITLDRDSISESTSEVLVASGFIPVESSVLKLLLTNNSVSTIEYVDIRMTLWKFYVGGISKHLTVCPFGYADHTDNPNFILSNLSVTNIFNETFSLKEGEGYPFSINFNNLGDIQLIPSGSQILLRVDVNFVKSASGTNHKYMKLYALDLYNEYVIDIDVAPDRALVLNDKKSEKEIGGTSYPSLVYPFQEKEFIEYFEKAPYELNLTPGGCREFELMKEQKTITY